MPGAWLMSGDFHAAESIPLQGRLISYTLPEQELYTTFLPSEHPLDLLRCIDDSRMLAISKDTLLVLTGGGYASMTFRCVPDDEDACVCPKLAWRPVVV